MQTCISKAEIRQLPSWIHVNISNYLKSIADSEGIASLVSGIEKRSPKFEDELHRVEFRVHGPEMYETSKGYFELCVGVNVLVWSLMDDKTNRYYYDELLGIFAEALCDSLPIVKCPGDGEPVGCLNIRDGKKYGVRVHRFDNPDLNDLVRYGMVVADYTMCLTVKD